MSGGTNISGAAPGGPKRELFASTYRPVRLPWLYRPLSVLMVVVAMAQPLVYLGAIAGIAWATVWWGAWGVRLLSVGSVGYGYRTRGLIFLFRLFVYFTPLAAGLMIVLLLAGAMVPSRREPPARGYPLARIEHPLIYAYVDKLCDVMRAPRPVRIDLRTDANASASFDGGWFWIVRRRMVLTIGTTLVAGMTRRELTGVIAHEIGHFTQGMGMRSTRLLEAINRWFFRVIHERGMVDDVLEDGRESGWLLIVMVAAIVAWTLAAIRVLLWTVASGSRLMTMAMLRRMEIAADRCEIRVAGSDAFVRSMARIVELNEGFRKAFELTRLEAVQRRLPEDFAGLAVSLAPRLPRDRGGFVAGFREPRSLWSTHPPMERRVAMAAELDEPGIVLSDGPAARLLPGFGAVCRAVTMHSHREALGASLDVMRILSTDALLGRGEHDPGRVQAAASVQPSTIRSDEPRRTPEFHGDVIPFAD